MYNLILKDGNKHIPYPNPYMAANISFVLKVVINNDVKNVIEIPRTITLSIIFRLMNDLFASHPIATRLIVFVMPKIDKKVINYSTKNSQAVGLNLF